MNRERLYFRVVGKKLCLFGAVLGGVAIVMAVLLGNIWMMAVLTPLPLLGFGLSMIAIPGNVRIEVGTGWEKAWMGTRVLTRMIWLAGLTVGIALGLILWMLVIPFVEIVR